MSVIAIIGGQWGDEGKGKIIDTLAGQADIVIRFSGGPNAGHTVINPHGEFKLHLVPSGIFNQQATCIIGNGVVLSPQVLQKELKDLSGHNIDTSRLLISERSHIIMSYHTLFDRLEEESKGKNALGTTLKGVGPAYADKVSRLGVRAGDLLHIKELLPRLELIVQSKNRILTKVFEYQPLSLEEIYSECCSYADQIGPLITDTEPMVHRALCDDKTIMLEGAQGTLLDIDYGTYPYVTSSSSIIGGACTGSGLSPTAIDSVIGVFKAYSTRVGAGPMPTELLDEMGDRIREIAHEYGATTGRPRRCGWFDAVAARHSAQANGFTSVAMTRLDILDTLPQIKICTAYETQGKLLEYFPSSLHVIETCKPVYEELPGWQTPISSVRKFTDLPQEAQNYVKRLQDLIGCPIDFISVGAAREESIVLKPLK
ncbi:MAG: adenylosuccinate synthase [Chloroflexota bacterium]|nr:adenylosuccinate synthase [Chloroflexota bacterium]